MKKSLAFILSAVMILSLLVGCGSSNAGNSNSSSGDKGSSSSADKGSSSESKNDDRVLRMCSSENLPTMDPLEQFKMRMYEILWNVYLPFSP